ncbi:MAG: hypothetical protein VE98_C0001G0387 [candidate division Kazan bacterium GW2011_GWA1_50_15]|uniref:Uncharacterized protein n=2 Tax=Bacteria division Kazan-3B-28 TaxID=1798534 RepID=A0A0G1X6U6_UNCK3|nr:MAG: hypothetical protein VE98_C0001G0387 [candidate division Kazan bacterium GW2011_GWA1_50_15]KKW25921.1 MAG: hypothetical protein VE99_C0001G0562 [candidate division Kazan bacterium GW2011_GWC1_52_13]KKW26575.1 MAG: hypothetical protein VF00_C0003G0005 [candidate division Kazan bacterium GW2011_GWB1_52_7]HAV65674.1 hypothetical protein [Patescibacteria group bacterium]HCR42622.1 hypothetical protein [Patescibacteria group bacterium]
MSKKRHKQLRELQRLQALHREAGMSAPTAARQLADSYTPGAVPVQSVASTKEASSDAIASESHTTVKRDLVVLIPLLLGMVGLLFVAKWATDNTALMQWILSAGRLFN